MSLKGRYEEMKKQSEQNTISKEKEKELNELFGSKIITAFFLKLFMIIFLSSIMIKREEGIESIKDAISSIFEKDSVKLKNKNKKMDIIIDEIALSFLISLSISKDPVKCLDDFAIFMKMKFDNDLKIG